ncbi:MAG: hypothetical protein WD715_05785, partial [Dongiaceae bacterium]
MNAPKSAPLAGSEPDAGRDSDTVRRVSVSVDRATGDLRRGLPVLLGADTGWLVLAAETATDHEIERMHR